MRIKWKPMIIMFFIVYFFVYALTSCSALKADEPTITVPYTEEQICKALLRAEICDMSQEQQEQYFLEIFKAFIDEKLNKEKEEVDICLEMVDRKLRPCAKGLDI